MLSLCSRRLPSLATSPLSRKIVVNALRTHVSSAARATTSISTKLQQTYGFNSKLYTSRLPDCNVRCMGSTAPSSTTSLHPRVQGLYDFLATGIEDMLESNPGMSVKVVDDVCYIELPDDQGQYTISFIQLDPVGTPIAGGQKSPVPLPVIQVLSPVSGSAFKYTFCPANLWWVSHGRGPQHLLVEILTRELIKTCKGYPAF